MVAKMLFVEQPWLDFVSPAPKNLIHQEFDHNLLTNLSLVGHIVYEVVVAAQVLNRTPHMAANVLRVELVEVPTT
ncbi:hypothetical protein ACFX2I_000079 [Malus domestica]